MLMQSLWKMLWILVGMVFFYVARSYAVFLRGTDAWGGEMILLLVIPAVVYWLGEEERS